MPTQLLIYAPEAPPDAAPGQCHERGDLVDAKPAGHVWGRRECLPMCYVIHVPDAAPAQLAPFFVEWGVYDTLGVRIGCRAVRRYCGRGTPATWRDELAAVGSLTKSWAELRPFIWDKVTDAPATQDLLPPEG